MSSQHKQYLQAPNSSRSSLELATLCGLAVVSATVGVAGTLAYVTLSWSHLAMMTGNPSATSLPPKADPETRPADIPIGVESGLIPVEKKLQLRPTAVLKTESDAIATTLITYEADVLPLVVKHGVDEAWFEDLCRHWATFSNQTWSAMSDAAKAEFSNELLYRLKDSLHPETLAKLGRRDRSHYSSLTYQREQAGQPQMMAHKKADERFFRAFPSLKVHQSEILDTGFDEVWFGFLEDVIRERPVPIYREKVALDPPNSRGLE